MYSTARNFIACAFIVSSTLCQPARAADVPVLTVPKSYYEYNENVQGTRCWIGTYVYDTQGYLYFHDMELPITFPSESLTRFGAGRIKKLSPAGIVSVVSEEVLPCGFHMALDGLGNLYLMRQYAYDYMPFNGTFRMSLATGALTQVSSATGYHIALDAIGNIYYNPKGRGSEIRKITADGTDTVLITGLTPRVYDCLDSEGCIYFTRDSNGNLFTIERTGRFFGEDVDTIKKFGPSGGDAATPQVSWTTSPTGGAYLAKGLTADGAGNVFFVQLSELTHVELAGVFYSRADLVKIDQQNSMSVVLPLSDGTYRIGAASYINENENGSFHEGYALNSVGADGNFYATKTVIVPWPFPNRCGVGRCVEHTLVRLDGVTSAPPPGAASIQVTQAGTKESLTLSASITIPSSGGSCAAPKIWIVALVPQLADAFYLTPGGWQRSDGSFPHYASGTGTFNISLLESANVSALEGTTAYLAYGCTPEETVTRGMYSPIYTVH